MQAQSTQHMDTLRRFISKTHPKAIALFQERPAFWEHLLTAELLECLVARGKSRLEELRKGMIYRPLIVLSDGEAMHRFAYIFGNIMNIATSFVAVMDDITPSWGPSGVAGNPLVIHRACQRVGFLIDALIDWETDLRFTKTSDIFSPLFQCLHDSTVGYIDEIARVPAEIIMAVTTSHTTVGVHRVTINLVLATPPTLKRFNEELQNIRSTLG